MDLPRVYRDNEKTWPDFLSAMIRCGRDHYMWFRPPLRHNQWDVTGDVDLPHDLKCPRHRTDLTREFSGTYDCQHCLDEMEQFTARIPMYWEVLKNKVRLPMVYKQAMETEAQIIRAALDDKAPPLYVGAGASGRNPTGKRDARFAKRPARYTAPKRDRNANRIIRVLGMKRSMRISEIMDALSMTQSEVRRALLLLQEQGKVVQPFDRGPYEMPPRKEEVRARRWREMPEEDCPVVRKGKKRVAG